MLPPTNGLARGYLPFTSLEGTNPGIQFSPAHPARCTPWASGQTADRCIITIRLSIVGFQVCSDLGFSLVYLVIDI